MEAKVRTLHEYREGCGTSVGALASSPRSISPCESRPGRLPGLGNTFRTVRTASFRRGPEPTVSHRHTLWISVSLLYCAFSG